MNDKQEAKFQELTGRPVGHLVCKMAVPTIISMMVTACYNMVDTYFVGQLHSNSATGAVGVVFSLMAVIQAVGFFFGHGSGNYISRQLGRHETADAEKMAATGVTLAFLAGCVILVLGQIFLTPLARLLGSTDTILPYARSYLRIILLGAPYMTASFVLNNQLRFQGSASYAMVGITAGAVLNIALDPIMIFWMDLGVAGAGFLAMAVMIFGQWKPFNIFGAAMFFAVFKSLANIADSTFLAQLHWSSNIYNMMPFVASMIILAFTSKNSMAPKAEGIPYDKGSR